MSFHNSCQNIHLIHENGSTLLHVEARRRNGEVVARTIRLDRHIGNTDGWFIWGGSNFTESSHDIQLEHTERGPKLTAHLRKNDGGYRELQGIYLADKIANEDGHLVFLGP
ncbi:Cyanovirin-N [Aspergillus sclerotioniger CBS 115572]|uniref:Cyanovirin-N n=1 Tax=Aspergillus sclerotioniger CBS 115572 TaxID=1450535 RepID=A0A317WWL4_9EURO|nr:Cyanovirin-N [Aspergillus sclerotioniger CBS 115572]PWY90435.1 Cyanovirin-N [Aspergillus sclerotioniger CBS 115572]